GEELRRERHERGAQICVRGAARQLGHADVEGQQRDRKRKDGVGERDEPVASDLGDNRVAVHTALGADPFAAGPRPRSSSQLAMWVATSCQPSWAMIQWTRPGNSRKSVRAVDFA